MVGLAILLATSLLVRDGKPLGWERSVFHLVNDLPDFLYRVLWIVMQGGNFAVVPVAAVVLLLLRRWRPALAVALVGVGKYVGERAVKAVIVRHRPAQILEDVILRDAPAVGRGYLSGHVIVAVGVATVLTPWVGGRLRILLWVVAGVVCFGRMYVGAHLPLDVVGGAALGWALGSLIDAALAPGGDGTATLAATPTSSETPPRPSG